MNKESHTKGAFETSLDFENALKMARNEMDYYEKYPPFRIAETDWQKFVSLFWNWQWVRKLIGGRWVINDLTSFWLPINERFPEEWLKNCKSEDWGKVK